MTKLSKNWVKMADNVWSIRLTELVWAQVYYSEAKQLWFARIHDIHSSKKNGWKTQEEARRCVEKSIRGFLAGNQTALEGV